MTPSAVMADSAALADLDNARSVSYPYGFLQSLLITANTR